MAWGGWWQLKGKGKRERREGGAVRLLLQQQQQHLALQSAGSCCCLLGFPSFSHLLPFKGQNSPVSFFTDPSSHFQPLSLSLSLTPSQTLASILCLHLCTQLIVATVFISLDLLKPKFQVSSVDLLSLLGTWVLCQCHCTRHHGEIWDETDAHMRTSTKTLTPDFYSSSVQWRTIMRSWPWISKCCLDLWSFLAQFCCNCRFQKAAIGQMKNGKDWERL
jgi:hypothetical protein